MSKFIVIEADGPVTGIHHNLDDAPIFAVKHGEQLTSMPGQYSPDFITEEEMKSLISSKPGEE